MTLYKPFQDEGPFCDFVESNFPSAIKDHLPAFMNFKSIEYRQDEVIHALLNSFISRMVFDDLHGFLQQMTMELGYFHLRLESEEDLRWRELPSMEFVFQKMHEEYSFITTYFFYLTESGLKSFVKMWTFESDVEEEEEGDELEDLDNYTELIDSYFYESVIPERYQAEIAKMMLVEERS